MTRLRFVQEYRGQRIVTDGKLYGVKGELVTDCRYLNVKGACEAIVSEASIALRKKRLDGRERPIARNSQR